jgi:hypothetical protein
VTAAFDGDLTGFGKKLLITFDQSLVDASSDRFAGQKAGHKSVANFADNVMATTRIANNTIFMNIGAYKAFVQREKDDVKEFSRIAANTARTFENNSRESVPNNRTV